MTATDRLATLALAGALALGLAGCSAPEEPADPPATVTTTVTPLPEPTESSAPTEAAVEAQIPTECSQISDLPTGQRLLADLEEQPVGDLSQRESPAGDAATFTFGCSWFAGDATGGSIAFAELSEDAFPDTVTEAEAQGYACTEADAATTCTLTEPNEQYPVDAFKHLYLRDGVMIAMNSSNIDLGELLPELEGLVWP